MKVQKIDIIADGKAVHYSSSKDKVSDIIEVSPVGDRYYRLDQMEFDIFTDSYRYCYCFRKGFVTNFRSGGFLVDFFIDQIGDQLHQVCWICHDGAYTPCSFCGGKHPISRYEADNLLGAMLRFAGESKFGYQAVYYNLRVFGSSAYNKDDALTPTNKDLFTFVKSEL